MSTEYNLLGGWFMFCSFPQNACLVERCSEEDRNMNMDQSLHKMTQDMETLLDELVCLGPVRLRVEVQRILRSG